MGGWVVLSTVIPVFKLYGEGQDWATPDLLHCETIPKRSRVHHWEIQAHRHADLCQLLYLHKGVAQIEIEGQSFTLDKPALQVVPPLCVHGFRFSENVDGFVLTLAAPLVTQLHAQPGVSSDVLGSAATYPAGRDRAYLSRLFSTLQHEYQSEQPGRDLLMLSLVNVLGVWVGRQFIERHAAAQAPERGREYFSRFSALVERRYVQHRSIEQLAHEVGISVAHLNVICRELAGQSALQVVHQRLLLEAKRNLIYTNMTINQLAERLGFADPAYFSRFFRRLTGVSPKIFRQQDVSLRR
ncbi:MAG: helix-turn-helix domain-containing protein [Janthinobacterium lividum]